MSSDQTGKFAGSVAVVTGGASGIGLAIARKLAAESAQVFVMDINEQGWLAVEPGFHGLPGEARFVSADVSDRASVETAAGKLPGVLNILVNNAGISHIGSLENTTEEDLDRVYAVNLRGVFNTTKACLGRLKAANGASIVNMCSVAALTGLADRFAYSMSKGGVLAITRSIARDYLEDGIRCNSISPARVHTPFVDDYLRNHYPGKEQEMFAALSATQPVGRMGTPEEVAAMVAFLCSTDAEFITGSDFPVDGGFTGLKM